MLMPQQQTFKIIWSKNCYGIMEGKKIMILFGDLVILTPTQSLIRLLSFLLRQKINKNEKN